MKMKEKEFEPKLKEIIALLEERGYDPKVQIYAYLVTGDVTYITRYGGARQKIKQLEKKNLMDYLDVILLNL